MPALSRSNPETMDMMSISVSARALVAARAVDPEVSTAAVRAAVEVALADQRRELEIRRAAMSDDGQIADA
ncbi:MAG TPA: hypothetical protein VFY38_06980 [Pseudonocardia sp.]|nr:hypothetical protein [Pseudonocardia sp.]